ncbi:thyroid hormone-induced protein B-like [Oncorhynchus keta]|uniref:thyroid hormone-induced protein B-like n=1 Tax=Oncorhynchus keta TaxID=8018 RepID=UPI00227CF877|nr:thyroid hormone-induced protein B-like [Oncorhynchus keta]
MSVVDDVTHSAPAVQVVFVSTCLLMSVPGLCNFETGHCGYIQDKEGDWVLVRGPTPTSYTGLRVDHTTGVGYYMHIEASNMLPGQNARLFSNPLRRSMGSLCLRFFYHMYGLGIGELSVHLSKNGEDELLWKHTGEQSITWLTATVEYQSDQQHQIVFEAIGGSSIRSDIAIDSIVFESGLCPGIVSVAR